MKLPILEVFVTRWQMLVIWLFCCLLTPILMLAMFLFCFGPVRRAAFMAVAFDEMGNAMLGGDPRVTISQRVGNGLVNGEPWAPKYALFIDAIFGKNHCISQADKYQEYD